MRTLHTSRLPTWTRTIIQTSSPAMVAATSKCTVERRLRATPETTLALCPRQFTMPRQSMLAPGHHPRRPLRLRCRHHRHHRHCRRHRHRHSPQSQWCRRRRRRRRHRRRRRPRLHLFHRIFAALTVTSILPMSRTLVLDHMRKHVAGIISWISMGTELMERAILLAS